MSDPFDAEAMAQFHDRMMEIIYFNLADIISARLVYDFDATARGVFDMVMDWNERRAEREKEGATCNCPICHKPFGTDDKLQIAGFVIGIPTEAGGFEAPEPTQAFITAICGPCAVTHSDEKRIIAAAIGTNFPDAHPVTNMAPGTDTKQ
jgi:hypothetical protein